ncbi:hypothetical protein PFICI_01390 [Pestalotiopsis fici W106-1]|uniref:C2H2-type domain-containing protein n=1 Tax=Pestalotiopsis fici (strain W106-1 / CGMCC3.15140) TaxID=1229662 RepID=W3XPW8_PESFW|nr:uncharacterized protein PFICI_01390 [Pestalotiopsis fici W106-1]ETS87562.1 hypothetical protein PFICI_01390 [Pestalotiopsis fici W106-1]
MSSNPRRSRASRFASEDSDGLSLNTINCTLKKGATFHSSPTTFQKPSLPRRSQTNLDDVIIDESRRRAAQTIGNVDSILAGSIKSSWSDLSDESTPFPRNLLDHMVGTSCHEGKDATMSNSGRSRFNPRRRSPREHASDSGLGTSIASSKQEGKEAKSSGTVAAITRSAAIAGQDDGVLPLSDNAQQCIEQRILNPLLSRQSFKDFHSIVRDCPKRMREKQIVCLRDLEKTLLTYLAPVSQLLKDNGIWGNTYRALCLKGKAKTADLYLDFCTASILCIQATVEYLSPREQTQPHDRPYSPGYFTDLVASIEMYAEQLRKSRERQAAGEELDEMDVHPTDELKLSGGFADTGRPAELVRITKSGKAISIATGLPVEDADEDSKAPIRFKRSMSEQLEDEEEIMRSMARRKKNATPEELAPKKCKEPGCNKEFKRPCDLTKHEKTHSRPFKCSHKDCKYYNFGWPTQKEMERHENDKHSNAPVMFKCHFEPCPYKSKRESNCKQHMEKAHGWSYVRTKTNGKGGKAGSSAHPTPMITSLPTPSSGQSNSAMSPPENSFPTMDSYQDMILNYASSDQFNNDDIFAFDAPELTMDLSPVDNNTPSTDGHLTAFSGLSPDLSEQLNDFHDINTDLSDIYYGTIPAPTAAIYDKTVLPMDNFNFYPSPVEAVPQALNVPHISPAGHGNTMLYTPASMAESMVDEGFVEYDVNDQMSGQTMHNQMPDDFVLFDPKRADFAQGGQFFVDMDTTPSAAAGFTQPSSQDYSMDFSPDMDWMNTESGGGYN